MDSRILKIRLAVRIVSRGVSISYALASYNLSSIYNYVDGVVGLITR